LNSRLPSKFEKRGIFKSRQHGENVNVIIDIGRNKNNNNPLHTNPVAPLGSWHLLYL